MLVEVMARIYLKGIVGCKVTRVCDRCPCQVCHLLGRFSLLLTCAGCVEIEDSSFIPFGTMEDLVGARALP